MSVFFWSHRKKWVSQWNAEGKRFRKYFDTEQEALAFESDRVSPENDGQAPLTFAELTVAYFRSNPHKHPRLRKMMAKLITGRDVDGTHVSGAGEFLHDLHAEKLTRQDLERMREGMRANGLSNNSINKYQAYIHAILGWGVEQELIHINPWRDYKRLPVKRHLVTTNLSHIKQVYDHAPEWLQWAIKTMYALSLRSGQIELFGITWSAFDFNRGVVTVRQAKSGNIKRVFPPEVYMREASKRYAEDMAAGLPLVCHRKGKRVLNYSKAWAKAVKDAGLPHFPMHHIRHAAATESLAGGGDPASVAAQLGHSNITTTCTTYAHVTPGGQKRAAEVLPAIDA